MLFLHSEKKRKEKKRDFYCPNYFYLFRSANMVNSHEIVFRNYNCCQIVLPDEEKKYHHGEKSTKLLHAIYVHIKPLLRKKGDYFCSNCFNSFGSANKVNWYEKDYRNHNCCQIVVT